MARHRQTIGKRYQIEEKNGTILVRCTYMCPYCDLISNSSFEAPLDSLESLKRGGFFEELKCEYCGKISDVRFWHGHKN